MGIRRIASRIVPAVFAWSVLAALYLLFAGEVSWSECAAGLPAVTAATIFLFAHASCGRAFRFPARALPAIGRALLSILPDTLKIGLRLSRALLARPAGDAGSIVQLPFRHGDAEDAGRRAIVTLGASLAPNGFVLRMPADHDIIVMHRLVSAKQGADLEWPV